MIGLIIGICIIIAFMVYACVVVGDDYDDNE